MKVLIASNHSIYRQNRYRFNEERQCWQFDDGVGPWTNSASLRGMSKDEGMAYFARMAYKEVDDQDSSKDPNHPANLAESLGAGSR